jgi:hypothetical protein
LAGRFYGWLLISAKFLYRFATSSAMLDQEIRAALKSNKVLTKHANASTKIVDELHLSCTSSRIDVAVVNGYFHGFEIKGASDNLKRLPDQIEGYSKVFDYLTVVTEEEHLNKILDITPEWVGVMCCSKLNSSIKFKSVRKPQKNKSTEPVYIAKLLWRDELLEILNEYKIKHRKSDRNWLLCEQLCISVKKELVSTIVRDKLKQRNCWKN